MEIIERAYRKKVHRRRKEKKMQQEKEVTRVNFELLLMNSRELSGREISAIKVSNVVVGRDFYSSSSLRRGFLYFSIRS